MPEKKSTTAGHISRRADTESKRQSRSKTPKSKEESKKNKQHSNKHRVNKTQRGETKCLGAKKLPNPTTVAVTAEPFMRRSGSSKYRTSISPVRSVSQMTSASMASVCLPAIRLRSQSCTKSEPRTRPSSTKSTASPLLHRKTTSLSEGAKLGSGDASQQEKKKKKQNLLVAIKPANVESEKARFMARLCDYNPHFVYLNPPAEDALERFSKPSKRLLDQAIRIMNIALKKYGSYENFEATTGGPQISRREFTHMFKEYVAMEGLENKVLLNLGEEIVSRALMTRSKGKPCLSVRVSTLRQKWAPGLLRHELGTHHLRSTNNKQQPWRSNKGREAHNLLPANPTEEGLASLHSVLYRNDPCLWRAALLYYTTYKASLMSFSNLFRDLERFVSDPGTRWNYCVRAKRGLVDTSEPGCFSKDQVYLTGVLEILRYRHRIDFHSMVRMGKVAYQDVDRLKPQAVLDPKTVKIPFFMMDLQAYKAELHHIMTKNGITDVELVKLYPDVGGEMWCSER